jgi:hypothetical protein
MNEDALEIMTYKRVWKFPRILYKFERFKLPRPVTLWQVFYWFVAFVVVVIINRSTHVLDWIPAILRYIFLPGAVAYYLSKVKHDGRAPHRWLFVNLKYQLQPKYYSRYIPLAPAGKKQYNGDCTFREVYEVELEP